MDGNMVSDGCTVFEYDSANRLIKADGHTYTYNAEDVRIRNLCSDADTTYTYNTNCRLSQLLCKTTNGITTKYVYGLGLIGEEKECCFKTYHFDFRGSTVAITDISGNITDTFKYDTYGKLVSRTGNSFIIFGYNGRDGVVTEDNGLIYMRARYYSPELRRFINADIIHGEISNAITLNRYAYANGNPVSNVDPFGLAAEERGRTTSAKYEQFNPNDIIAYLFSYTYYEGFWLWRQEKKGHVYIYVNITKEYFDSENFEYPKNFNEDTDLLIADLTNSKNPNMYAYQAQKVSSKHREAIINIMKQYDEKYSTPWNRTEESLEREWNAHHMFSSFDKSAQDIDFDNDEEDSSYFDYVSKAIKRGWNKIFG